MEEETDYDLLIAEAEGLAEPASAPRVDGPTCEHCSSSLVNPHLEREFSVKVCKACFASRREEYASLTKTRAKAEFLLSDTHLASLPCRAVSSKTRFHSDAKLYLRRHLVAKAREVHGDALEEERKRRIATAEKLRGAKLRKRDAERAAASEFPDANAEIAHEITRQRAALAGGEEKDNSPAPAMPAPRPSKRQVRLAVDGRHVHVFGPDSADAQGNTLRSCLECRYTQVAEAL